MTEESADTPGTSDPQIRGRQRAGLVMDLAAGELTHPRRIGRQIRAVNPGYSPVQRTKQG
jgi:hypothetical protein